MPVRILEPAVRPHLPEATASARADSSTAVV
jgi:hypothetical protein